MSESADAVAANMTSRRNVTIEITNLTNQYCLLNPKVYLDSGTTHIPPQPTVRPLMTEVCNFSKTSAASSGAVGVLTYDLYRLDCGKRVHAETVAVMFSVPYDRNVYSNWFSVGVYKAGTECDESLYKSMYYDKEKKAFARHEADGSAIAFKGEHVDVMAAMTSLGRAIMKMEVWEKVFV